MNKKLIIQIVIIVVSFGAAGVVLYNGFFSGGSSAPASLAPGLTASAISPASLLPYGPSMDFTILSSRPFQFPQSNAPQLDPNKDLGVPVDNLVTSGQ